MKVCFLTSFSNPNLYIHDVTGPPQKSIFYKGTPIFKPTLQNRFSTLNDLFSFVHHLLTRVQRRNLLPIVIPFENRNRTDPCNLLTPLLDLRSYPFNSDLL